MSSGNPALSTVLPPLFRIGAQPLAPGDWLEIDGRAGVYLEAKEKLGRDRFADVFVAEPGTDAAQAEILDKLVAYLPERFPEIYRRSGNVIDILPAGRRVRLDDADVPPLWTAAMLVPDDLLLMRRDGDSWRLVAGALCFPSSWRLTEKFGRPMETIHAPVPGFGAGTRNAQLITRMFDNLRPEQPMIRGNWSLYGDDHLFHPEEADPDVYRFGTGAAAEHVYLRRERQTVSKLPQSGDILFTVGITVEPLEALAGMADGPEIAAALRAQIAALDADQLSYKGLTRERDRVLKRLGEL